MTRPNLSEEFVETLDDALVDLGYPEHVVKGASHPQKVSWLIIETDAGVDVEDYL